MTNIESTDRYELHRRHGVWGVYQIVEAVGSFDRIRLVEDGFATKAKAAAAMAARVNATKAV